MHRSHIQWNTVKTVHFIGISGIGMSALAQFCHHAGRSVQGSCLHHSSLTRTMADNGVSIFIGHCASVISSAIDVVVVSSAIDRDNAELCAAHQLGIPVIHRSDLLRCMGKERSVVAITGTHGKTTTTAMIGHCLRTANLDPLVMVGGIMNNTGTNVIAGLGAHMVVEADESDKSHVNFDAIQYGIITNIDTDHMDTYDHSWSVLLDSFCTFIDLAHTRVIMNGNDPGCQALWERLDTTRRQKVWLCGTHTTCAIRLVASANTPTGVCFSCHTPNGQWDDVQLTLWGAYNTGYALLAIGVSIALGIPKDQVLRGLHSFSGVQRRMQVIGHYRTIPVIDDYAHHPASIKANLQILHDRGHRRVLCLFQPHRYTRLRDTMHDLKTAFLRAAACGILPVYDAGEHPIDGATSQDLVHHLERHQPCHRIDSGPTALATFVDTIINQSNHPWDAIIIFGAGTSSQWAHDLVHMPPLKRQA